MNPKEQAKYIEDRMARDLGTMVGKTLDAVEKALRGVMPSTLEISESRYDRESQSVHLGVTGAIPGLQAWETDQPAVFILARAAAAPGGVNVSPMDVVPEGQVWQLRGHYYVPPSAWADVLDVVEMLGGTEPAATGPWKEHPEHGESWRPA